MALRNSISHNSSSAVKVDAIDLMELPPFIKKAYRHDIAKNNRAIVWDASKDFVAPKRVAAEYFRDKFDHANDNFKPKSLCSMFIQPVTFFGGGAAPTSTYIQSIQYVEIVMDNSGNSITYTLPVTVDATKAWVWSNHWHTQYTGGQARRGQGRLELTNGTTVTGYRQADALSLTLRGYVVEGKAALVSSVQAGVRFLNSASTGANSIISSVDTSRSCVFYLGDGATSQASTTDVPTQFCVHIELTSATTVAVTRTAAVAEVNIGWAVVEFQAAVINNVQKVSVTNATSSDSYTATISAVVMANSFVAYNGLLTASTSWADSNHMVELTNTTTVTFTRNVDGSGTSSRTLKATVVEFVGGVLTSMQRSTITINSTQTNTATISAVNLSFSVLNHCGANSGGGNHEEFETSSKLNSTTQVLAERVTSSSGFTNVLSFEVLQFA